MDKKIKKYTELILWGKKKSTQTLRSQISRIIMICCMVAVIVQAIVMIGMIMTFYINQEKEDTKYLIENANNTVDNYMQFVEELVLAIRHNTTIQSFYGNINLNQENAKKQLQTAADLYSERNRLDNQEPFVEKVYIFNWKEEGIFDDYYPVTVTEENKNLQLKKELHRRFLKKEDSFYYEVDGDDLNICLYMYDDNMTAVGTCILVLNCRGFDEAYKDVSKLDGYYWAIRQEEKDILSYSALQIGDRSLRVFEDERETSFGLSLYLSVPTWTIYKSLGTTIFVIFIISVTVILAVSLIGSLIARHFVHPLETVANKIKQVGCGDFNTKLGEYKAEELNNISETFNEMTNQINHLVNEVYETQLMAKQSQIQYLQSQMNPHFLFNVLSMIKMKAAANEDTEVQKMIYMLSKLFQGKIFRKDEIEILLEEEMEIVDFYLYLQNHRFGDKITYSIQCEDESLFQRLLVPRLSIELIVENAVCHGLEPKEGDGFIQVKITANEYLNIEIIDNGVGFDMEEVQKNNSDRNHSHVGILNTNKMIKNLYGEPYGIHITSEIGKGTRVLIVLPKKESISNVEGNDC